MLQLLLREHNPISYLSLPDIPSCSTSEKEMKIIRLRKRRENLSGFITIITVDSKLSLKMIELSLYRIFKVSQMNYFMGVIEFSPELTINP